MISFNKNDKYCNLSLMENKFESELQTTQFLAWFLKALDKTEIINKCRHIETCPICNKQNTLNFKTNKPIGKYEYRIPNGDKNLVVDSSILHLVSVHHLIPNDEIITALEKIHTKQVID